MRWLFDGISLITRQRVTLFWSVTAFSISYTLLLLYAATSSPTLWGRLYLLFPFVRQETTARKSSVSSSVLPRSLLFPWSKKTRLVPDRSIISTSKRSSHTTTSLLLRLVPESSCPMRRPGRFLAWFGPGAGFFLLGRGTPAVSLDRFFGDGCRCGMWYLYQHYMYVLNKKLIYLLQVLICLLALTYTTIYVI